MKCQDIFTLTTEVNKYQIQQIHTVKISPGKDMNKIHKLKKTANMDCDNKPGGSMHKINTNRNFLIYLLQGTGSFLRS